MSTTSSDTDQPLCPSALGIRNFPGLTRVPARLLVATWPLSASMLSTIESAASGSWVLGIVASCTFPIKDQKE